ncbi:trypsin-like peptidase domain-containing protein [Fodinibius sp. AD559]|uniref:trypsin-like peptidase domain-containing protein n=1 Tax=Fodinibius sp. AD559 TaxID=3424179 RepID=UPI0040468C78
MKNWLAILSLFSIALILTFCSSTQQSASTESSGQQPQEEYSEYYTSAFPHKDISSQLKNAQQSVVRIVSTGFYDNYNFSDKAITLADIKTNNPGDIATSQTSAEESTSGTAIILGRNKQNSLLITCEHTVFFPDTMITYYKGPEIPEETYIESISIKKNQTNLVYTSSELQPFEVIATNPRSDLALLNVEFEQIGNLDLYPLTIEAGNSDFLQLGSFLYVLGFPKSYPMVTRGLASSSESWNDRFFVTDATFNPGISGGLILASDTNYETFEWVGMASSSTASREEVLVPHPQNDNYSRIIRPYSDSVFVQQKTRINYGITQAIPINQIKEFLNAQQSLLKRKGFKQLSTLQ